MAHLAHLAHPPMPGLVYCEVMHWIQNRFMGHIYVGVSQVGLL